MELIWLCVVVVSGIIAGAASPLLADELKAWRPWLVDRLIRCAVRALPEEKRTRYDEEYRSHIDEVPGELSKLLTAFGCIFASKSIVLATRLKAFSIIKWIQRLERLLHVLAALSTIGSGMLFVGTSVWSRAAPMQGWAGALVGILMTCVGVGIFFENKISSVFSGLLPKKPK